MRDLDGYFTPYLVLTETQIAELFTNHTAKVATEKLEAWEKQLKAVGEHRWANSHFYLSNTYGDLFKFLVIESRFITIWSQRDEVLVKKVDLDVSVVQVWTNIRSAFKKLEQYSAGQIDCSHCGKEVDIGCVSKNRYYAGVYCNECWERDYKALEAKENYN